MGTHLIVLSESFAINTKMAGFRWFLKDFRVIVFDESSLSIERAKEAIFYTMSEVHKQKHEGSHVSFELWQLLGQQEK